MSARSIVSGALFRAPESKTSKAGRPYALATIREGTGELRRWWKAFIFSASAIEEVSRLGDGDPIAVAGEIDAQIYTPAGSESRINWSVRVDAILSARPKPREAKPKAKVDRPHRAAPPPKSESRAESLPSDRGGRDFDDSIPF
jgi:hypothetical protein